MSDDRYWLPSRLLVYSELVKDDPNTPGRYVDLVEQAALALATGDEDEVATLCADYRTLDDESLDTAHGAFLALYRKAVQHKAPEYALEGINLLVERVLIEKERRARAA